MKRLSSDVRGSVAIVLTIIVLVLGLAGAIGFAVWAFGERQDYKNNVNAKINQAIQDNTKKVQADDAAAFAEESKNPLKTFVGPEAFGTVNIIYPKSWSAYAATGNGAAPVNFYAHPDVVPSVDSDTSTFALRVQVVEQKYSAVLQQYAGQQKQGKLTVKPYALPKVPTALGSRLDGQLTQNKQGSMVVLPIRDKTLKIWTESNTFLNDFNDKILPNASFAR
jgi:hypothetical protein